MNSKNLLPAGCCNCNIATDSPHKRNTKWVLECADCKGQHYFNCEEFGRFEEPEEIDMESGPLRCDACHFKARKQIQP